MGRREIVGLKLSVERLMLRNTTTNVWLSTWPTEASARGDCGYVTPGS